MSGWGLRLEWLIAGLIAGGPLVELAVLLTERRLRTVAARQAMIEGRTSEHERHFAELDRRIDRLGALSDARELDQRAQHDEEVGELLGSLLLLNDALR